MVGRDYSRNYADVGIEAWVARLSHRSFEEELRAHFDEAWNRGYEPLIPRMKNDEKDRHVVAAAVHGAAAIIVTLNHRHFRPEHVQP